VENTFKVGPETQCQIDAAAIQKLGANFVKVWIETGHELDRSMSAFAKAGIYVWVHLQGFGEDFFPVSKACSLE